MQRMHDLTGKVAIVTGVGCVSGGVGNGMAIAALFARQGAIVFGCDLVDTSIENTRNFVRAETPSAVFTAVKANVTSAESVKSLIEACMTQHGRVDILVNNVGVGAGGDASQINEQTWDSQIDVNLKSVYLTSHFVLPYMERQGTGGVIVNVSSLAALRHLSDGVGYATAKGAVISFSRSTALTYAKRGIRVNTVIPGMMNTPLLRAVGPNYETFCKLRDSQCPMGRMGTAWDTANAVLFLSSNEASYITGTEIIVDGGYLHGGPK